MRLLEVKRGEAISQAKGGDNYVPSNQSKGKNRYARRLSQKASNSTKEFNKMDMNKFFKTDVLDVNIKVTGETNDYLVKVEIIGILRELQNRLSRGNPLSLRDISRSIVTCFNSNDIKFHCTCPDWCLEENTLIKLLNGETVTVKELKEKYDSNEELWVYSTDENGDFKPGKVTDVWISGMSDSLIKVTLDNDKEILTTPNHKYMLRDGSYKPAEELILGESLMPLYFRETDNGYETVKSNSRSDATCYYSVYKIVANEVLSEEIQEAKIRSGEEIVSIHHKDFNKSNNSPSNLYPMGHQEHWKYHSDYVRESGVLDKWLDAGRKYWSTQEAKDKQADVMRKMLKEYYSEWTHDDYQKRADEINSRPGMHEKRSNSAKLIWENYSDEEYKIRCDNVRKTLANPEVKKHLSEGVKAYYDNMSEEDRLLLAKRCKEISVNAYKNDKENICKKQKLSKISSVIQDILNDNEIPSEETYIAHKKKLGRGYPNFTTVFSSWKEVSEYFSLNHKIKSIETIHLEEKVPVYDISVDKYNNFYVDSGVILHNCYRQGWWAVQRGSNASADSDMDEYRKAPNGEAPDITNPDDSKGGCCKHVSNVIANNSWIIKVASVIFNYINYMEKNYEDLYQKIIYPAVYGEDYEDRQMSFDDFDEEEPNLSSDEYELDTSNEYAKTKNQFKPGNEYRFKKNDDIEGQKSFNFDSELNDNEE